MILQLPWRVVADATAALSLVLALVIAYQAFRGYRRNDSRPMLFLAVGFVLMIVLPISLTFALRELLTTEQWIRNQTLILASSRAGTLSGLCCIVYSLYDTGR